MVQILMAGKYLHWCPNACGKRVIYRGTGPNSIDERVYICSKCGGKFTKKEIDEY